MVHNDTIYLRTYAALVDRDPPELPPWVGPLVGLPPCRVGQAIASDRAFVTTDRKKRDGGSCKCGWSLEDIAAYSQSEQMAKDLQKGTITAPLLLD